MYKDINGPLHRPSLYSFRAETCSDEPGNSVFSNSVFSNSIFSAPITSTFNAVCFEEHMRELKMKTETVKGFKFCTLIGPFEVTPWQ